MLISGFTVIIAMAGMLLSGDKTFMSFAIGTMMVVAVAMIGSLTVLPAILSRLGDKVEKGRIPFLHRLRKDNGEGSRFWGAILKPVLRHPVIATVASTALLLVLALPALHLHTADSGLDALPKSQPELAAFHVIDDAFPGGASAADVAITGGDPTQVKAAIADLKARALASGEMQNPIQVETSDDGRRSTSRSRWPVVERTRSRTTPSQPSANELVPATIGTVAGVEYAVGGSTAKSFDFNAMMKSSAPLVFGFVLLFAFLLLLVAFRSIVIALKAIVLNLLSVAAAYGMLVAVFQWGWGENLLDFNSTGGIASWLPMFLFVILFGLSMDYHVFILSRVREAYDRGLRTQDAVEYGIRTTAGVVTGASIVMVGVFSVFALTPLLDLKMMGIGLAAAILIDATIVRAVLLPASMMLLGEKNWYLPKWLEWLPNLEHDGSSEPIDAPSGARADRLGRYAPQEGARPGLTGPGAATFDLTNRARKGIMSETGLTSPQNAAEGDERRRRNRFRGEARSRARHRRARPRRPPCPRRQPPPAEPGTSAADHLVSGLVPLAALAAAAACYGRLRAGLRACDRAPRRLLRRPRRHRGRLLRIGRRALRRRLHGLLSLLGGFVLLGVGIVTLWRSRRDGRPRRLAIHAARADRCSASSLAHRPVSQPRSPTSSPTPRARAFPSPTSARRYEDVAFTTSDGLRLKGWYIPSRNGAAVIAFPGRSARRSTRHADPRTATACCSSTAAVRARARATRTCSAGAATATSTRPSRTCAAAPDVDPRADRRHRPVGRRRDDDPRGRAFGCVQGDRLRGSERAVVPGRARQPRRAGGAIARQRAVRWRRRSSPNKLPPPSLKSEVPKIAPSAVFFVYGEHGQGGTETEPNKRFYAAASEPKQIWEVPNGQHIAGITHRAGRVRAPRRRLLRPEPGGPEEPAVSASTVAAGPKSGQPAWRESIGNGPKRARARAARDRRGRAPRRRRQLPPAEPRNVGRRPPRKRARPARNPRCSPAALYHASSGAGAPSGPAR